MIKESVDFNIAVKESKDSIVDPLVKIHIRKSNYVEESYVKTIQYMDISCEDLVSHEDEKLTNFEVFWRLNIKKKNLVWMILVVP